MKALLHLEIAVPPRKDGIEGVDLSATAELPFVPHIGMHLMALPHDEFRQVDGVYWSAQKGLEVFFEADENARLKDLKKLGWKEDA